MSWDAGPVIEGDRYYVELIHDKVQVAQLTWDEAETLADALRDAWEPEPCMRSDCSRYAVAYGLCDLHVVVTR